MDSIFLIDKVVIVLVIGIAGAIYVCRLIMHRIWKRNK